MVAHATSDQSTATGLRPINSMRDIVGVTTLIERAFAEEMDTSGHNAMRDLRWMGRLFGWADWFTSPGQGLLPGYVWMEQGRIVEQGPHAQLLAAGGLYARLHAMQFRSA